MQFRPLGRVAIGAQLAKYNFCTSVARSCIGIQRARVRALVRVEPFILHFPLAPDFALREADRHG